MRKTRRGPAGKATAAEPAHEKIVGPSDKINIPTDLLRTFVAIY
ncbi:MAG: hypothetical protein QOD56_2156, partial [Gammaproteobacteria bacterium]|nr:hypothetical protein [Gammaproteobacteria bacterium]